LSNSEDDLSKRFASFASYDVLGYVVPGAALMILVVSAESLMKAACKGPHAQRVPFPILTAASRLRDSLPEGEVWAAGALLLLVYLSYLVGHIVASLSGLLIDRALVAKGYGYPYWFLLNFKEGHPGYHSQSFFRGSLFWTSSLILIWTWFLATGYWVLFGFSALIWLLIGGAILAFAKEVLAVERRGQSSLGRAHPNTEQVPETKTGAMVFLAVYEFAYEKLATQLSKLLHTRRAFDETFCSLYEELFFRRFGLKAREAMTNNFWYSYLYVLKTEPEFAPLAANWLRLYAFARNLSCALFMATIYVVALATWQFAATDYYMNSQTATLIHVCLATSVIMLLRYWYLYVCYYSKFVFRAFVYSGLGPKDVLGEESQNEKDA
jgi:hypothetical protein